MWPHITSAVQAAGSSPMFTWRNGDSRIELSGVTFLNAVSKAANFILDGLEVESGQPVYVNLGNHWQSPVWNCAVIAAGAVLSDVPAEFNIVNSAQMNEVPGLVAVVSRDPFGMPERELPSIVVNASAEVRGFGDHFAPRTPTTDETALATWGVNVQQARELAVSLSQLHNISPGSAVGAAVNEWARTASEWHCFFSIFNKAPLVILDGEFDLQKVAEQERVMHFVDLR